MGNKSRLVLPGDPLGVEEEFIPINGAYADRRGYIRSTVVGYLFVDHIKKNLFVKHVTDKPLFPKLGDVVEGVITNISDDLAFIDIYCINDVYSRTIDFSGILHVSQASVDYVKSLLDLFRLGEIVKAKVINNNHPFQLTTKDPALGVIAAYCSTCGSPLWRKDDKLVCGRCGSVEARKISFKHYVYR